MIYFLLLLEKNRNWKIGMVSLSELLAEDDDGHGVVLRVEEVGEL